MSVAATSRSFCPRCRAVYRSAFARCPSDGHELRTLGDDPLVGTSFAGRYVVEASVGEGAMSRVYRVRHASLSRRFALKVLFGELAADATMRMRFAHEAEMASRLEHPNVVSVLDFGRSEAGLLYLIMDFVEGADLGQIIAAEGPLPSDRVVVLARQLLEGLAHAHERGLVHRDFKPENVVVLREADGRETARILDFGLAISAVLDDTQVRLTQTGTVVGTPLYIAPEQACGLEVDHRADLFSFGICLYEMLAGRPPFDGPPMEVVRLNVTATPSPIGERTPGVVVPEALERIVFRLLARDRDRRYASAAEVLEDLDAFMPPARRTSALRLTTPPPTVTGARASDALATTLLGGSSGLTALAAPPRPRRARGAALGLGGLALVGFASLWSSGIFGAGPPLAPPASLGHGAAPAVIAPAPPSATPATSPGDVAAHVVAASTQVERAEAELADEPLQMEPMRFDLPSTEAPEAVASPRSPDGSARPARATRHPPRAASSRARAAVESPEAMTRRYQRIVALLNQLESRRGAAAAAELRQRFFALPYADALRIEALRADVVRQLRRLERDARAALD